MWFFGQSSWIPTNYTWLERGRLDLLKYVIFVRIHDGFPMNRSSFVLFPWSNNDVMTSCDLWCHNLVACFETNSKCMLHEQTPQHKCSTMMSWECKNACCMAVITLRCNRGFSGFSWQSGENPNLKVTITFKLLNSEVRITSSLFCRSDCYFWLMNSEIRITSALRLFCQATRIHFKKPPITKKTVMVVVQKWDRRSLGQISLLH